MRRPLVLCAAYLKVVLTATGCQPSTSPSATVSADSLSWRTDGTYYALDWANISVAVNPAVGGRIVSLRVDEQEMLTGPETHPVYYGSTLWLSPQHRWWPPPPPIDSAPYRVHSTANPLTLISPPDTALGLQVIKSFRAVAADSSLRLRYTVVNQTDTARSLALWEVTRLKKDSEVRFILDTAAERNRPFQHHTAGSIQDNQYRVRIAEYDTITDKAFYNSRGGLVYSRGDRHLLKQFPDLALAQLPPRQNEVEIYIDDSAYLEVEQHSPYQRVAPGDSLIWTVCWYPRVGKLPKNDLVDR